MADVLVRVTGVDEALRRLSQMAVAVQGTVLAQSLVAAAMPLRNRARERAPYRTGTLRSSIEVLGSPVRAAGGYAVQVGTNLVYAPVHEFGAVIKPRKARMLRWQDDSGQWHAAKQVTIPARPYLRPAAYETADVVGATFAATFTRLLGVTSA